MLDRGIKIYKSSSTIHNILCRMVKEGRFNETY
jgi:hypothetical protein